VPGASKARRAAYLSRTMGSRSRFGDRDGSRALIAAEGISSLERSQYPMDEK